MIRPIDNALIDAVADNDTQKVRELLEQGANPNIVIDDALITPLHFAAQNNAREIALLLYTAGADLNSMTDDGETPIDIAKEFGHSALAQLLLKLKNQNH
ncbi:MAG: ankyrin repeat domain-containing protein [Coxiellaceae bacterium]|nr:MAG: ankyrin repeat domain-containing protein [Coxiellaceae bacterium]